MGGFKVLRFFAQSDIQYFAELLFHLQVRFIRGIAMPDQKYVYVLK